MRPSKDNDSAPSPGNHMAAPGRPQVVGTDMVLTVAPVATFTSSRYSGARPAGSVVPVPTRSTSRLPGVNWYARAVGVGTGDGVAVAAGCALPAYGASITDLNTPPAVDIGTEYRMYQSSSAVS